MSRHLVAVSHGTADPAGQARVQALVDAVAARITVPVSLAHVDVQQPEIGAVLASLAEPADAVVVPLLLTAGYHVHVDLRRIVDRLPDADGRIPALTGALGPDDRIVDVLVRRALDAGFVRGHHRVVLASAGSSDESAVQDCHQIATRLADQLGAPVSEAYVSAAHPRVPAAVGTCLTRHPDRPVMVLSHLLAPGFFQSRLRSEAIAAGASIVTPPMLGLWGPVPESLVDVVVDRFVQHARAEAVPGRVHFLR